ncbi:MAG TPA: tetratricopeptide repeat protein [Pirellulaceae bacterium]|nr:tetratricopeptide repeat protein [Pirellulaceae bacterium]
MLACGLEHVSAQEATETKAPRGSFVEDQAARKLLEAGDSRLEAEETVKAVEIWKSVIERYPRSKFRFDAHMRLGKYFLDTERAFDRARVHFEASGVEDNRDEEQRAEATLRLGVCYYHQRNFGKCFQLMRDVIERFPVSPQVNEAYYYIGLGHYQLGHYSRAISALDKVGTALSGEVDKSEKLEAGKRFFLRIEDADLAVLDPGQSLEVECITAAGDKEKVAAYPVGRNVRLVLGSIPTKLGKPVPGNGILEVHGGDSVLVKYIDSHTADRKLNVPVERKVAVVGNAAVAVTDGAYAETLRGVVLDKPINVRIIDADRDSSDNADKLQAIAEVYRPKTDEELEAEANDLATKAKTADGKPVDATSLPPEDAPIDRFKLVDRVTITLTEAAVSDPNATPADATGTPTVEDKSLHTGVFRATVPLIKTDVVKADDDTLQAISGDIVRLTYVDEMHTREGVKTVKAEVRTLEGNIGGVRVTKAVISDEELRIQTQLKTSQALTAIGNRYKEFGLKEKADDKYQQALSVCEDVMDEARKLGGNLLEQSYVQIWNIYFEMDKLDLAAAMCQRLQNEFPNSGFVDDALLQLGEVARKQKDFNRAIGIFTRLVNMKTSQLRGEAQFGIAECYEQMAADAKDQTQSQLQDRAFQEYKQVFDQFPESGRVGEAVAKMANYYYLQKDYARAVDTFETVLADHPDAKFLDVILFNYGRCLFRMGRKPEAKQRFEQLLGEFPESPLAVDAKKIADALAKPATP